MRRDEFPLVEKLVKETSDKAVNQAIEKIAEELKKYTSCSVMHCPCAIYCNSENTCKEWLAEWMKGIVEEV